MISSKTLAEAVCSRHAVLALQFLVLMCISNVLEEYVYSRLEGFEYYWFMALLELLLFSLTASYEYSRSDKAERVGLMTRLFRKPRAPLRLYLALGTSMALGQSLGKVANRYVNFTVSTIFKCAKAGPTFIIGYFFLRRAYQADEIFGAFAMAISALCFALGAKAADGEEQFNMLGIVYNLAYLFFQATQLALQEVALKDYDASVAENMFFANGVGSFLVFAVVLSSGELFAAISYFAQQGTFATVLIISRTLTFFLAVHSYSAIIKEISAVSAVTIGILRKILTILFSMLLFRKPFARAYLLGAFFLVFALVAEARVGLRKKRSKSQAPLPISRKHHLSDPDLLRKNIDRGSSSVLIHEGEDKEIDNLIPLSVVSSSSLSEAAPS